MDTVAIESVAVAIALALTVTPAAAAVITTTASADISTTPYTITFEPGETLSFSNISATTNVPNAAIGVQTTGGAEVFSELGQPVFFQTFANTLFPSQQAGAFASYSTPTAVPYSIADGLVGFEYSLGDGVHYGVADIGGNMVFSYRLDTTAGQSFGLAVPEPATWTMLLAGVALIGGLLRRRGGARVALGAR